jgi:hypothetical protein
MTARRFHLVLSAVTAVAMTVPLFRMAATEDAFAGDHLSRHRPLLQQRVLPAVQVRDAQALSARISALKNLSRRSRASQPLLLSAALHAGGSTAQSRLFFPLRC